MLNRSVSCCACECMPPVNQLSGDNNVAANTFSLRIFSLRILCNARRCPVRNAEHRRCVAGLRRVLCRSTLLSWIWASVLSGLRTTLLPRLWSSVLPRLWTAILPRVWPSLLPRIRTAVLSGISIAVWATIHVRLGAFRPAYLIAFASPDDLSPIAQHVTFTTSARLLELLRTTERREYFSRFLIGRFRQPTSYYQLRDHDMSRCNNACRRFDGDF
jgi:hypothetical protein